jgi:hypothetical protein
MWLRYFPDAMKRIFTGAGQVVFGVIRYWYYTMTIPAVWAVYYLLKALQDSGIMDNLKGIVNNTLTTVAYITQQCFPLILNFQNMLSCINNSPSIIGS